MWKDLGLPVGWAGRHWAEEEHHLTCVLTEPLRHCARNGLHPGKGKAGKPVRTLLQQSRQGMLFRDYPGGPVAKTPRPQCRGPGFYPCSGDWLTTGGLPSMGSHRVAHDWSDLAAAAAVTVGILFHPYSPFLYQFTLLCSISSLPSASKYIKIHLLRRKSLLTPPWPLSQASWK